MTKTIRNLLQDESGATAIEYGLIAGLVAVALIASLQLVGSSIAAKFTAISTQLGS